MDHCFNYVDIFLLHNLKKTSICWLTIDQFQVVSVTADVYDCVLFKHEQVNNLITSISFEIHISKYAEMSCACLTSHMSKSVPLKQTCINTFTEHTHTRCYMCSQNTDRWSIKNTKYRLEISLIDPQVSALCSSTVTLCLIMSSHTRVSNTASSSPPEQVIYSSVYWHCEFSCCC